MKVKAFTPIIHLTLSMAMLVITSSLTQEASGDSISNPEEPMDDVAEISSATTSCGGGGQACCANSTCNSGFSCSSNVCRANTIVDMNFARLGLGGALGPNNRIFAVGGWTAPAYRYMAALSIALAPIDSILWRMKEYEAYGGR